MIGTKPDRPSSPNAPPASRVVYPTVHLAHLAAASVLAGTEASLLADAGAESGLLDGLRVAAANRPERLQLFDPANPAALHLALSQHGPYEALVVIDAVNWPRTDRLWDGVLTACRRHRPVLLAALPPADAELLAGLRRATDLWACVMPSPEGCGVVTGCGELLVQLAVHPRTRHLMGVIR